MQVKELVEKTFNYHKTCTINNPIDNAVTFATSQKWFNRIVVSNKDVYTLIPKIGVSIPKSKDIVDRVKPIEVENLVGLFVAFHNFVNQGLMVPDIEWGKFGRIDCTCKVGREGMRYVRINDVIFKMRHMGTVVFGDRVEVGSYTVISRGTIDNTTIGDDCKIGALCSIGHNVVIGKETMITPGTIIGGSTVIGSNCWIGMRTVIRDHLSICDRVKIGMGSVVTRSINEPGLYFGSPAKKRGEWNGEF